MTLTITLAQFKKFWKFLRFFYPEEYRKEVLSFVLGNAHLVDSDHCIEVQLNKQ